MATGETTACLFLLCLGNKSRESFDGRTPVERTELMGTRAAEKVERDAPEPALILGPHDVPFTQYLRPNGRRRQVCIERPPTVVVLAQRLLAAGYHFDIEELMDGTVSMTVEPNKPDADGDDAPIAIELCPNGPAVPPAVDRLIEHAGAILDGGQRNGEA